MEKYVILADITCDLTGEIREFVGMDDYIKGHISITDGGETKDYQTALDCMYHLHCLNWSSTFLPPGYVG